MKKTFVITALAIGLITASCGNQSGTEENRTDSAGVTNSESTDSASLDQNGVVKNADSTINGDSSTIKIDSTKH